MADESISPAGFYVYVHTRNDTGEVFYVGKGRGKRFRTKRHHNPYWMRVAAKHGFTAKVIFETPSETCAHTMEKVLIFSMRRGGASLCNLTDGGEGVSGFTPGERTRLLQSIAKRGKPLSPEHREKIRQAAKGREFSEAHKKSLSEKEFSAAHRAALSAASKGRRHSPETIAKIASLKIGLKPTEETRQKMSRSRTGSRNGNFSGIAHTFFHPDHGIRTCTQNELRRSFGLPHGNLSKLVSGSRGSVHGWTLVKPGG